MNKVLLSSLILFIFSCNSTSEHGISDGNEETSEVTASRIVFLSSRDSNYDIYSINSDGSSELRLTTNPEFDWYPKYSKALGKIVYNSMQNEVFKLSLMDPDGENKDSLAFQNGLAYLISPDGKKLLYSKNIDEENSEVFIANSDGSNELNLSDHPGYDGRPKWSTNGKQISFISERDKDGDNELFVMNSDGSNITQLTFNTDREKYHTWSPGDQKIAFVSYRDNEYGEIYIYDFKSRSEKRITDNLTTEEEIAWAPEGNLIAFHGKDGEGKDEIFVLDAERGEIQQVTFNDYYEGEPDWTPANRKK